MINGTMVFEIQYIFSQSRNLIDLHLYELIVGFCIVLLINLLLIAAVMWVIKRYGKIDERY